MNPALTPNLFIDQPGRPSFGPTPENLHPHLGVILEQTANILTLGRAVGGVVLRQHIESKPDYQSWKTCAAFVLLAATDGEGELARRGRHMQGKDETIRRPLNAYGDHLADKVLIDAVTTAIANREIANGNHVYGKLVDTAAKIVIGRDIATTVDRIAADVQEIDTRAQKAGKKKAVLQYAVTAIALSPIARAKPFKALLGVAFLHTAKQSITSGLSLHQSFTEQRQFKQALKGFSLEPSRSHLK